MINNLIDFAMNELNLQLFSNYAVITSVTQQQSINYLYLVYTLLQNS